jgi:hypothetical protein
VRANVMCVCKWSHRLTGYKHRAISISHDHVADVVSDANAQVAVDAVGHLHPQLLQVTVALLQNHSIVRCDERAFLAHQFCAEGVVAVPPSRPSGSHRSTHRRSPQVTTVVRIAQPSTQSPDSATGVRRRRYRVHLQKLRGE